jgi:hypothetical protein
MKTPLNNEDARMSKAAAMLKTPTKKEGVRRMTVSSELTHKAGRSVPGCVLLRCAVVQSSALHECRAVGRQHVGRINAIVYVVCSLVCCTSKLSSILTLVLAAAEGLCCWWWCSSRPLWSVKFHRADHFKHDTATVT